MPSEKRVVAYIDGFNLYHALGDLGENHLKWLDLRALAETFAPRPDHQLIHVFYCTAYAHWRPESCARHEIYIRALAARQVTPLLGRFKARDRQCRKCGARWIDHEEKESDVSLGIALVLGAADDRFDRALLFTRDSDLVPAVKMARKRAPDKEILVISPDWYGKPSDLINSAGGRGHHRFLRRIHVERALLPLQIHDHNGVIAATRPTVYDPPRKR
jgi:hypothetical protein